MLAALHAHYALRGQVRERRAGKDGVTRAVAVIPARWASVRLGKALVVIGAFLVQHVWGARRAETVGGGRRDGRRAHRQAVQGFGGAVTATS